MTPANDVANVNANANANANGAGDNNDDGGGGGGVSPSELSAVVDGLLDSLTNKFSCVSKEMFGKSTFNFLGFFI